MINPVLPAANAFLAIWNSIPQPIRALFGVFLVCLVIYAVYKLLKG